MPTLEERLSSLESEMQLLKQSVDEHKTKEYSLKESELVFAAWSKIVDTQMHFNDMVMRVRNLAVTLILAVFGAAAYGIQYQAPQYFLDISGHKTHVSFLVVTFGVAGWFALWILDTQHFHLQLRGAVEFGKNLENKYSGNGLLGNILGMTNAITKYSRTFWGFQKVYKWPITAAWKINIFYLAVFTVGVYYGDAIWRHIKPLAVAPATHEQIIKVVPPEGNTFTIRVDIPERNKPATREKAGSTITPGKAQ